MEAVLILKAITLGADLLNNAVKAYNANREAFSSEEQTTIDDAIASLSAANTGKATTALSALEESIKL